MKSANQRAPMRAVAPPASAREPWRAPPGPNGGAAVSKVRAGKLCIRDLSKLSGIAEKASQRARKTEGRGRSALRVRHVVWPPRIAPLNSANADPQRQLAFPRKSREIKKHFVPECDKRKNARDPCRFRERFLRFFRAEKSKKNVAQLGNKARAFQGK